MKTDYEIWCTLPPKPMKEPNPSTALQRKLKKAYRSTTQYKVDQLLAEQTRWQRKLTIATNKLAAVRKQIDNMLCELATPVASEQEK